MLNRLYIVCGLFFIILFCSCDQGQVKKFTPQPDAKKIKIGVIGPMTGTEKSQGLDGIEGIKTAMQLQPALFNGDWFELVVEDDQDDPELAVKALKKLTEVDKVAAILMFSSSKAVLAVDKEADQYGTPVLALVASHPDIARETKFVNQICFDNDFQGKVAALYARDELLDSRVAVFVNNENPYSKSLAEVFTKKFKETGGEITVNFPVDTEMDHLVDTLKYMQKQKTELLYMPVGSINFIKISKALNDMDWHPVRMGSDGLLADVLTNRKSEFSLLEGIAAIDFYANNVPLTPFGKRHKKAFRKLFNGRAKTYAAAGVEGYAILIDAIVRSGDYDDKSAINKSIRETVDFDGFLGKITIQPNGKAQRPLFVNTIEDGRLKFLVKVY